MWPAGAGDATTTLPDGMKVLSVVGNRPQFIKSAPLSLALREAGIEEVVAAHRAALRPRRCRRCSSRSSGWREPAYRLDLAHRRIRTRCCPAIDAALESERPDCGARLRRHELDARRRERGRGGRDVRGPRRGRAAQRRPDDAGGAQPHRGRPDRRLLLCPDERSRAHLRARGRRAARRGRRRRHGRRQQRCFAPLARDASDPRALGLEPGATSSPPCTERRTSRSRGSAASWRAWTGSRSRSSSRPTRARAARRTTHGIDARGARRARSSRSATSSSPRSPRRRA